MGKTTSTTIPILLLSIREVADAISVSTKMVHKLINSGKIRAINLGMRMTRISLDELIKLAEGHGYEVDLATPSLLAAKVSHTKPMAETGCTNKRAKCRKTPKAGEKAPEGVTHDTHYTMAEVMSKFNINST